jgi:hypothetical protein
MTTIDESIDKAILIGKKQACLELMQRVRNECLGLDADGWTFHTGKVFGEYLRELEAQEKR